MVRVLQPFRIVDAGAVQVRVALTGVIGQGFGNEFYLSPRRISAFAARTGNTRDFRAIDAPLL